jgi:hypothetical protein
MAKQSTTQLAAELIRRDFAIDKGLEGVSEEELFQLLADHIDWLIEHRMEWLLSLMYRMDIDEAKVQWAISPLAPEPANIGLARLVLERQKQRAHTKQTYKPEDLGEEWEW